MIINMTILKALRLLASRNLLEQSRLTKVHPTTLCRVENGILDPSKKSKDRLTRFYGLKIDLLLDDATPENLAKISKRRNAA